MDVVFAWVCAWIIFIIYIILYYVSLFLIIPIMLGEKVPPLIVEWSSCFFSARTGTCFGLSQKKDICPKHWFLMCSIYIPRCHHLNQTWHKLMKQQRLFSYVLIKVDRRRVSPIKQARPGFHIFVPDCWCESSCALYYGLCQRVGSEGKRRGN